MILHIDNLIPMQRSVRDSRQIKTMVEFVLSGGVFDRPSLDLYCRDKGFKCGPLIQVDQFEDGLLFPRDGHHRLVSIWLAGRDHLLPGEYAINERRYEQYMEINLKAGWVTPFDPRTEIRIDDLANWKNAVAGQLLKDGAVDDSHVIEFIRANKNAYTEPRGQIRHVRDIARHLVHEEGSDQQVLRRIRPFP